MDGERKAFTVRAIDAMAPGSVLWDGTVKGLYVERQKGSARVYRLKTRVNGRQRHFTIGEHGSPHTPETARKAARDLQSIIDKDGDPHAEREKRKATLSVREVAQRFLDEHCGIENMAAPKLTIRPGAPTKPGTARGYRDLIRGYVVKCDVIGPDAKPIKDIWKGRGDGIGDIKATAITTGDIAAIHHHMRDTPRAANHLLSCLSVMTNWASERGIWPKGNNPTKGIKRFKEHKRTKYLDADETRRLIEAIARAERDEKITPHSAAALRFLLLTGLRPREALNLRWKDIDFATGTASLANTKTGDRSAALSTHALQLLTGVPKVEGNEFIFVGLKPGRPLASLQHAFETVREAASLGDDVVLYSLRHNFGTALAHAKTEVFEIMRAMGHVNVSTSMRYIHIANAGVQASADRATQGIADLLKGGASEKPSADVVALPVAKSR
jgi:integrase